jgi:dTDP-4-dehydrorhamnose reductase
MRILVFGGSGMLGHKLVQRLSSGFEVWCTLRSGFDRVERYGIFDRERTIENVDVTDISQVRSAIEQALPDVVINAVGLIKQVPAARDVIRVLAVNSVFPRLLGSLSAQYGFRLITFGTDCVFSGEKGSYVESDPSDARDLYGISKFLGEMSEGNCLTLRTSIIGRELETGHSIVEWFLANRRGSVKGYVNAIYTGFPTVVMAEIVADIVSKHPDLSGVYHVSSEPISKFDLLNLLNKHFATGTEITAFEEYVIDRSLDSTRFREVTGFVPQTWDQMLGQMAADPTPYENWNQSASAI